MIHSSSALHQCVQVAATLGDAEDAAEPADDVDMSTAATAGTKVDVGIQSTIVNIVNPRLPSDTVVPRVALQDTLRGIWHLNRFANYLMAFNAHWTSQGRGAEEVELPGVGQIAAWCSVIACSSRDALFSPSLIGHWATGSL